MTRCVLLLILVCTSMALADPLKPAGTSAPAILLVDDGKPASQIVLPDKPTTEERKAAEDLQHWIAESSGATLPIGQGGNGSTIYIKTDASLPTDGYRIEATAGSISLIGAPRRGVINAVYALLEEDLGCRFYTNDSVGLPAGKTLSVAPVARTYAPKLSLLRDPFYFVSFDPVWSLRNRTNAPDAKVPEEFGGHVDYGGLFVHTAATLLPPDKYFKDHPDYFALNAADQRYPNQLCPTHPEVAKIVIANVLKTLKENPNTEIVSVSKNDNGGDQICMCDTCKKLREDEGGTDMANQLVLVNQVAKAVEKEYPAVWVDTLAYLETIKVPKTIRPRKNVIIRLCNDVPGAWSRPFANARDCPIADLTRQWSAVHDKLSIWDYSINFDHFLGPMPNMDIIADNIRFWTENKAVGVMTQAGYQSTSERDEMRAWVIAKLLWDPSRDVDALVEDFTLDHYGVAGPILMEYEVLLKQARKDHAAEFASIPGAIRYPMTVQFLNKDFLAKATDIYDRAKIAVAGNEKLTNRVERAELSILYVKLMQGPVTAEAINRFERIARREKVDWLLEWQVRLDQRLAEWRKQVPTTQPTVVSKGEASFTYQAFPDMCRLKNGDILVAFYAGYGHVSMAADDFPLGGRICMVRSSDEGRTWSAPEVLFDDADDNRDGHIAQLDDGSLICTFFSWRYTKDGERLRSYKDFSWKTWRKNAENTGVQMVTSHDNGKTWDKTARSVFPDWVCSAPVRQLPDGTCILGLYGQDEARKVEVGASTRSLDRGKTWEPPVVMPSPPDVSLDAETDIIPLKDGRLFAALRDSKKNMRFSISNDMGKSWSMAEDIGFLGHCPYLMRLSTGEILLTHRMPQTELHVSRDDARTWQGPYEIDHVVGAYPATVELKDQSVLIVYYTEGKDSVIRARRFKLNPDGIEFLPLN